MNNSTSDAATPFAGKYEDLGLIGSGSFGMVYQVRRIADGQIFARKEIKIGRMSERNRGLIHEEIRNLEQLKHENVVQFVEMEADQENETIHIVMEFCGGGDLYSVIQKHRKEKTRLSEDAIWGYIAQLVLALDACHYHGDFTVEQVAMEMDRDWSAVNTNERLPGGILHRDLKPENIFLDDRGRVKLGDFGFSRQTGATGLARSFVGTPYFMSPEIVQGQWYDSSSDIWALGCIAHELCTLETAFDGDDTNEINERICSGRLPSVRLFGYSKNLDGLIGAMLNLDPTVRPTTRALLTYPPIQWACKSLYLNDQLELVAAEKADMQLREDELARRFQQYEERLRCLDERERQIDARVCVLEEREDWLPSPFLKATAVRSPTDAAASDTAAGPSCADADADVSMLSIASPVEVAAATLPGPPQQPAAVPSPPAAVPPPPAADAPPPVATRSPPVATRSPPPAADAPPPSKIPRHRASPPSGQIPLSAAKRPPAPPRVKVPPTAAIASLLAQRKLRVPFPSSRLPLATVRPNGTALGRPGPLTLAKIRTALVH